MASIIRTDALQNLNTSNIITQTNATTLTIGASGQTISIPAGATLTNNGTASGFGLTWQSVQTTGFTAVAGRAYPCNTTSAGFTVTLPATPSAGDQVQLVDYAGTFDTNNLSIDPNGNKIEGLTTNFKLTGDREGVILTYIDATQGWIATSGINEGTDALSKAPYTVDFLVIAGGAGGGTCFAGGGGAGGYRTSVGTSGGGGSAESSLTFADGVVYTITIGAGGNGSSSASNKGTNGSDSSISGTGITTITSTGGGGGGSQSNAAGSNGGSGGGRSQTTGSAGSGTANQGYSGGTGTAGVGTTAGGGGGGAGAVGGNSNTGTRVAGIGGAGLASSITGSSVTRAGGGGGGGDNRSAFMAGGTASGGGGAGSQNGVATNGTANTGGGGGGSGTGVDNTPSGNGGNGGKGVVILSMPDASYSGTTTGSPTVTTGVSGKTVLVFNDSGSYTG
jgi:hypothetical protein